jgi:DNA-binding response OmpR family regulator
MAVKTILLVDDDTQHLMLHCLVLKKAGYRPIAAVVGEASFSFQENERPSLIFLDYRLNSTVGSKQVAELLHQSFPGTPVIVLSNMDRLPDEMKGIADGFLQKGDPQDLVTMADRLLGETQNL